MNNKAKRNLSLVMVCIGIAIYILAIVLKLCFGRSAEWWQYVAPAVFIVFFWGCFRNFSQAVKEEQKYGPVPQKKDKDKK